MDNSTLLRTVTALQTDTPRRIVVGMSGGVDSAVSAYLLKESGHEVIGLFMKNWEEDDGSDHCTAAADARDAKAVCDKLGIPFHTVNFAREYWERVFEVCLQAYEAGITPNPDVLCNREIKFKSFLTYAIETLGADCIATGHYVRSNFQPNGDCQLLKGRDPDKDQSYFLYLLKSDQIAKSIFPIGDLKKTEVRKIAESLLLPNAKKKDSTGICFIGERQFKTFLSRYLPLSPGNIVTETGEVLGEHDGLFFYTIGQRQGLSIGGKKHHSEDPWYVAQKDLVNNRLIVVQGSEHPLLYRSTLTCDQLSWVADAPHFPARLQAKIRYRQADVLCQASQIDNENLQVTFDVPQRAITPGQSIVFYLNDICLGGGLITE